MPTLIKNGLIVTGDNVFPADIMVKGGKIVEIGTGMTKVTQEIIDATGKYVLPGGIDASVHLSEDAYGTTTCDDFESGSLAAAHGGTTTMLCYAFSQKSYYRRGLEDWLKRSEGKSAIDYGFHLVLTNYNERSLSDIPAIFKKGVSSFICHASSRTISLNEGQLFSILRQVAAEKGVVGIHAGSGPLTEVLEKDCIKKNQRGPRSHAHCRSAEIEGAAANLALTLAEKTGATVFLRHISSAHALEKVKIFRDRGQAIFGESSIHHLVLNDDMLDDNNFDTARFVCSPPLRGAWHNESLWRGIQSGDISFVSSDHMPFKYEGQKTLGKRDFRKIPAGLPGIEQRMLLLYSLGVAAGRFSLSRLVQLTATNPAKIFGLYPQKGTISVGSDADLVIFNPEAKTTLSMTNQHSNVDYNPYEGMEVQGAIERVLLRGKQIVKDGQFLGQSSDGMFLKRSQPIMP